MRKSVLCPPKYPRPAAPADPGKGNERISIVSPEFPPNSRIPRGGAAFTGLWLRLYLVLFCLGRDFHAGPYIRLSWFRGSAPVRCWHLVLL